MGPITNSIDRTPEITGAELEAGQCLTEESPRLESGSADGPPAPPKAVQSLVDKHTAKKDWCGSQGSEWVPEGLGKVDWSDACKTHDECYGTPGANKYLCDFGLQQDISLDCAAQGGGIMCQLMAGIYFHGVRTPQGEEAFVRAQAAAKQGAQ
jgi:hypothetical protein